MSKPPASHTAYVLKRETRARFRYLEIGEAEVQLDGKNGSHHVYLFCLPIGGFSGHVLLYPRGARPPDPLPEPDRPGEDER